MFIRVLQTGSRVIEGTSWNKLLLRFYSGVKCVRYTNNTTWCQKRDLGEMTTFQVNLPEKFDFSRPEEWLKWSRRFERFRQASGLQEEADEPKQINTLIYAMGDAADDIMKSFQLTAEQEKKCDMVKQKFDQYFVVKRNVIFERVKFNRRMQEEGETVDSFVTALYCLAEHRYRYLPATDDRLKELRDQLQQDAVTRQIMTYCTDGWPDKSKLDGAVKPYWTVSGELTVQQGLLMKGSRLVIPISMRLDILDRLHEGHQGITRCREKDKTSVWWPGLSKQLEELVRS